MERPHCVVCGRQPLGPFYKDWAGRVACSSHPREEVHACHCCSRICGSSGGHTIGHGLWVCDVCLQQRMTQQQAMGVVNYIQNGYRKAGLGDVKGWSLKVSDLETLVRESGDVNVKGFAKNFGGIYTVYILRDLPKLFFASVLAHELLHIWQYRQGLSPEQALCEGFCNLGSWYVLRHIGGMEAEMLMRQLAANPDPIYGDGFRHVLGYYEEGGWPAAVQVIKDSSKKHSKIWQTLF